MCTIRLGMRHSFLKTLILLTGVLVISQAAYPAENGLPLKTILDRMVAHNLWQDAYLTQYTALRTFYADNSRFNLDATLVVETAFQQPESVESKVIRQEGSSLIREHVFDKILETEHETHTRAAKKEVDITPDNYNFKLIAREVCGERSCYHLEMTPKHKDKYSLEGEIWVDGEDFAISRIRGTPSRRPSFWTTHTEIDQRYKRVDGIWLTESIDSRSDVLVAGPSHLKIDYKYTTIRTGN